MILSDLIGATYSINLSCILDHQSLLLVIFIHLCLLPCCTDACKYYFPIAKKRFHLSYSSTPTNAPRILHPHSTLLFANTAGEI